MLMFDMLTDQEIEHVTSAVCEWCRLNHCDLDSQEGRRAITISVDLIQTKPYEPLLDQLIRVLGPFETKPEICSGNASTIDKPRTTTPTSS